MKSVRDRLGNQFFKEYDTSDLKDWSFNLDCSYEDFILFVEEHEGKGYGIGQIFGLLITLIFPQKLNPFKNGARYFVCNELVLLALQKFKNLKLEHPPEDYDLIETELILDKLDSN